MNTLTDAVKGTHCAYALRLEGDAHAHEYYYVGSTSDLQTRIAQHTGAIPGGAKWTALHPPTAVFGRGALRYRFSGCLRRSCHVGLARGTVQGFQPRARCKVRHVRSPTIPPEWMG